MPLLIHPCYLLRRKGRMDGSSGGWDGSEGETLVQPRRGTWRAEERVRACWKRHGNNTGCGPTKRGAVGSGKHDRLNLDPFSRL